MAKRFIDTELLSNPSIRVAETLYKLSWVGLLTKCDHAGIWVKDFEMLSLLVGGKIEEEKFLEYFGEDVVEIDKGRRYFIPGFIDFQYGGKLNPKQSAQNSAIKILEKFGIDPNSYGTVPITLTQGLQDIDTDKDKDKEKEKRARKKVVKPEPIKLPFTSKEFATVWAEWIDYKQKQHNFRYKTSAYEEKAANALKTLSGNDEKEAIELINASIVNGWKGFFPRKKDEKPKTKSKWAK